MKIALDRVAFVLIFFFTLFTFLLVLKDNVAPIEFPKQDLISPVPLAEVTEAPATVTPEVTAEPEVTATPTAKVKAKPTQEPKEE